MRAGVEALLLLLDWYGLAVLHVSHQGLRHGMLLAYLERGMTGGARALGRDG